MKHVHAVSLSSAPRPVVRAALLALAAFGLGACGSVNFVATTNIPTPLVTKVPVTVALHVPEEFATYIHKEERWSTKWNVNLGKAQAEGITRLMNSMFENVVMVESINAGSQLGGDVRAIFEPSVEEYAFVTPRDAGSPFFAVSIKYRVNIYSPDGRLADSWGFTGYGTSPSQGLSSSAPLAQATALAMRDAGAKLAVEFRDQAIVRGLLPAPAAAATPGSTPAQPEPEQGNPAPSDAPEQGPAQTEVPVETPRDTATPPEAEKPKPAAKPTTAPLVLTPYRAPAAT